MSGLDEQLQLIIEMLQQLIKQAISMDKGQSIYPSRITTLELKTFNTNFFQVTQE